MIKKKPPERQQIILGNWIITQKEGDRWKVNERAGDRVFSIRSLRESQWQTSAGSSVGSRRRPLITALNLEEAVLAAARILYPADFVTNDHPHLDLADAFNLSIKQSYAGEEGKALLFRNAGFFVDWADNRNIRLWEQLRQDIIHEYIQSLIARGLAAKTIRSYLEPVRTAGKRVVAVYPDYYRDPCYGVRIPSKIGAPKTVAAKVGKRGLTIPEVVQLYEHLMDQKWSDSVAVATLLCGLIGIRVREAIYLTWKNVDLEGGFIRIEAEEGHDAKTVESVRMIPIPAFVLDQISSLEKKGERVVQLINEHSEKSILSPLDNLIGKRYQRLANKWKPERYVPLSDLRNTLMNTARRNPAWPERLVEQYVGHVDSNVTGKHYQSTDPIELFDHFQNGIIPLLNSEIEKALIGTKWQENGKNPEVETPGFEAQIIEIIAVS